MAFFLQFCARKKWLQIVMVFKISNTGLLRSDKLGPYLVLVILRSLSNFCQSLTISCNNEKIVEIGYVYT